MWNRITAVCLGIAFAGSMACVDMDREDGPDDVEESGMNLVTSINGDSDVAGMRYIIKPVKCSADKFTGDHMKQKKIVVEEDLTDLQLPGGIPKFENEPFDEDSNHEFADYLKLVEPGCYDVEVEPIKKSGYDSKDCKSVRKKGVKVYPGKTTEILLISQCRGEDNGLLDTIAALNHPPQIVDFEIYPNKFVECPEPGSDTMVKICARASDSDSDQMVFDWKQLEGPDFSHLETKHSLQIEDEMTECIKVKLPMLPDGDNGAVNGENSTNGSYGDEGYEVKVSVFDQFYDDEGELIKAEKYLKENFGKHVESRSTLKFPIHLSCEEPEEEIPFCPVTAGVWEKYNKYASMPKDVAWPEGYGMNDPSEKTKICGKTWLDNLGTDPDGDAFYDLSHQYIAARLNQAKGAHVPIAVSAALFASSALLHHCPKLKSPSFTRFSALALAKILKAYNKGQKTSDQCESDPNFPDNDIIR